MQVDYVIPEDERETHLSPARLHERQRLEDAETLRVRGPQTPSDSHAIQARQEAAGHSKPAAVEPVPPAGGGALARALQEQVDREARAREEDARATADREAARAREEAHAAAMETQGPEGGGHS